MEPEKHYTVTLKASHLSAQSNQLLAASTYCNESKQVLPLLTLSHTPSPIHSGKHMLNESLNLPMHAGQLMHNPGPQNTQYPQITAMQPAWCACNI
jgi:hypothetical protein